MTAPRETIAAVATAPGAGGIGVVRVSGANAHAIARELLGAEPQARHAHYCAFRDASREVLDRGLLLWFPAPRSFTGEDVLELHAHGSPVVLRLLLARIVALGARQARPGEFSERAYLNGKLDLAQAEAIADLIASGSEVSARAALRSLDGTFSRRVHALTDDTIALRVHIEAAIDFPEEEIDFLASPAIAAALAKLRHDLATLLTDARRGVRLRDGLHVVILGRPNAGKSSLLNALAASDRAIVTPIPGTTRDLLRETIELDGVALTLVDTAGLHASEDPVEREGMRRARAESERADLALLVTDDAGKNDFALLDGAPASAARIVVHNKIDLRHEAPSRREESGIVHFSLSALTGVGLDALRDELKFRAGADSAANGAFTARARHLDALELASRHLDAAAAELAQSRAGELAAEQLRAVQRALGEITGEFTSDDLLGRIFGSFCIGK